MNFTDIPLRRSVPAGVSAYVVGYLTTYLAVASQAEALLREIPIELRFGGGFESFFELVAPVPETWKVVGWFFHASQRSKLVNPQLSSGETIRLDLVAQVGGEYRALYLVAPVALVVAGYLVARTGKTFGIRGEEYAGAAIALGYLPCAVAGGFLYTVGRPVVGPDLLSSIFLVGTVYPVAFGWLGGRIARMQHNVTQQSATADSEA